VTFLKFDSSVPSGCLLHLCRESCVANVYDEAEKKRRDCHRGSETNKRLVASKAGSGLLFARSQASMLMRLSTASFSAGFILMMACSAALGQGSSQSRNNGQEALQRGSTFQASDHATKAAPALTIPPDTLSIRIYLLGGGQMQVDEVTKGADGFWYKRGNVTTFIEKARVERIERPEDIKPAGLSETLEGSWRLSDSAKVENFFLAKFGRVLPLTAFGQSELHTRWGLDHRQSMDVGIHPDSPEGRVLINFLRTEKIPFLAFRTAVPGEATGPHIHIGKASNRLH
jgi:hypothetical protein